MKRSSIEKATNIIEWLCKKKKMKNKKLKEELEQKLSNLNAICCIGGSFVWLALFFFSIFIIMYAYSNIYFSLVSFPICCCFHYLMEVSKAPSLLLFKLDSRYRATVNQLNCLEYTRLPWFHIYFFFCFVLYRFSVVYSL